MIEWYWESVINALFVLHGIFSCIFIAVARCCCNWNSSHHVTSRCAFSAVCNCLLSYVTIKHVVFFLLSTVFLKYTQAFCVFGDFQNFCVEFCTTKLTSSFPFGLFFIRIGGAYLKAQAINAAWSGDTTATTFCLNLKFAQLSLRTLHLNCLIW